MIDHLVLGPVHHVGYVVRDLDRAQHRFETLGFLPYAAAVEDDRQDAAIVFLARLGTGAGEPLVELVAPRTDRSPVHAFAASSRYRIHHVCYAVRGIEEASEALRMRGLMPVLPIAPAPAIGGAAIAFFFSRETGLFELVENPPFP